MTNTQSDFLRNTDIVKHATKLELASANYLARNFSFFGLMRLLLSIKFSSKEEINSEPYFGLVGEVLKAEAERDQIKSKHINEMMVFLEDEGSNENRH